MITISGNGWRLQRHIKYPYWWKVLFRGNPVASIYIRDTWFPDEIANKLLEKNDVNTIDVNDKPLILPLNARKIKKREIYMGGSIHGIIQIETRTRPPENLVLIIAEEVTGKPLTKILNAKTVLAKKIVIDGKTYLIRIVYAGDEENVFD